MVLEPPNGEDPSDVEPIEPESESDQLPYAQREYIDESEVGEYQGRGLKVYVGPKKGKYVDESALWILEHIKSLGEGYKTPATGLHKVENHKPDIVEWENGEQGPRNEPPLDAEGKPLKIAQVTTPDGHKQDKIIKKNQARMKSPPDGVSRRIPPDAIDVKVSDDANRDVQATYKIKNPKTGKMERKLIKSKRATDAEREDKWEKFRGFVGKINKYNKMKRSPFTKFKNALKKLTPEEMDDSEKLLFLLTLNGMRHGTEGKYTPVIRQHEDGEDTAIGARHLKPEHIKVDGDRVFLKFRAKEDVPASYTIRNAKLAQIMTQKLKDTKPDDFIFKTTPEQNQQKLRELSGYKTAVVKNIRTALGTEEAIRLLAKELENPEHATLTKAQFSKIKNRVALGVGKLLQHKNRIDNKQRHTSTPDSQFWGGKRKIGELINPTDSHASEFWIEHAKEALKSYIDDTVWEPALARMEGGDKSLNKEFVPDWHGKGPDKERDIDEWAEARDKKGEDRQWGYKRLAGRPNKGMDKKFVKQYPAPKTWIESLRDQGYYAPLIKEVTPDGKKMWFVHEGIDYVANLGIIGHTFVEKAVLKPPVSGMSTRHAISYAPTQTNKKHKERRSVQGEHYRGDTMEDNEDDQ